MYVYGYNALLEVAVPTLIVQEIPTYINAITATKQRNTDPAISYHSTHPHTYSHTQEPSQHTSDEVTRTNTKQDKARPCA